MAAGKRRRRGSWLMFAVRALGVTGVFSMGIGAVGACSTPGFNLRQQIRSVWENPATISDLLFQTPDRFLTACLWLLAIGAAIVAIVLALLLLGGVVRIAGRRNLVSGNAALQ